jgi:cholesterol transport system auxiliary component
MRISVTPIFPRQGVLTALAVLAATLLLTGCGSTKPAAVSTVFDFGPAAPITQPAVKPALGALVVTDVTGSAALDTERMFYRLKYADPLEARTYAQSRWTATPVQLLTQRLKVRIAQSGSKVLNSTDASDGVPLLRIEVDEFTHSFDSVSQSQGELTLRASLFQGHKLIAQRSFTRSTPAASATAAGGAAALAGSTDAVAADIVAWLGTLPVPPPVPSQNTQH